MLEPQCDDRFQQATEVQKEVTAGAGRADATPPLPWYNRTVNRPTNQLEIIMAGIYIINVTVSSVGWPTSSGRYYHTEGEAQAGFTECLDAVGEDPTLIELIRIDCSTLAATTLRAWEGTIGTDEDPWTVTVSGGRARPTG